MYKAIKLAYKMKRITAEDVWVFVDRGTISADEAITICGPRPEK